jgi:hypothetical protein
LILCRAEGGKTTQPFVAKPSILKFNCIVNIIIGNELRAIRATRDHVLTDCLHAAYVVCKKDSPMLYLKNTLGGLSRSLTDSALNSFQGPHRWWKLALFAVLFVLPGGSVGMIVFAWAGHRRGAKGSVFHGCASGVGRFRRGGGEGRWGGEFSWHLPDTRRCAVSRGCR